MALVRYWAAAREAAGATEERYDGAATLAELLAAARGVHGERFATVVGVCTFIVDGAPVGRRAADTIELGEDAVVEVLPPFAGG